MSPAHRRTVHAVAWLLPWTCLLPGALYGQRVWRAPGAPYAVAEAASRPEPDFAWVTDSVGSVVGLAPLRSVSLPSGWREVRMWVGFGIVIPETLVRIVAAPDQVRGQLAYWWESWGRPEADQVLASFRRDIHRLAGGLGCASAPSGQTMISHRQDGRDTIPGWIEACPTDFGADEPDWDTVLDRLVAAHVFSLPDPRTLTPPGLSVLDGVHLQVETLEGDRYRTYRYAEPWDQPWPEARDAEAIMDVVRELEPPLRGDPGEAGPAPPPPMPEPRQETDCPPEAPLPPAEVVVRPAATPSGSPFVEIVGSVVEADTARAVAHARVAWSQRSGGDSIQADEGGVFRIRVRADEPVTLAIGSLGFRVRRDTLRVTRDTEVSARFPMVFFVLDRCGFGPVIR